MAQWVNRPRADGGLSIQIKWRVDGGWQSETFTDARLAAEFRTAVEAAGHQWPDGWVEGEGWDVVAAPTVVTFAGVLDPAAFPDATVWSGFGRGYGFVPLVLPVLGLLRLRAPAAVTPRSNARNRRSSA